MRRRKIFFIGFLSIYFLIALRAFALKSDSEIVECARQQIGKPYKSGAPEYQYDGHSNICIVRLLPEHF